MDLIGGMLWVLGNGSTCEVLGAVVVVVVVVVHVGLGLGDPVNIWTTCLKEELSAWTKVVGYGLVDSDLEMGLGDGSGGGDRNEEDEKKGLLNLRESRDVRERRETFVTLFGLKCFGGDSGL
ncbi:LOW QUALITY PROTEIN: hypothetical protein NC651_010336 [Populus alba x Populus x berolinensis]|nr:LOW QUALITY PROTEIN: hypothetical protein NC651_010336 [Populus alba x Populus x berolinensis]